MLALDERQQRRAARWLPRVCDCERVRVTGGGGPRCRKTSTWAQGKSLLSFRCGSSRWPRRRPASVRKGRLAVLDPAHAAPLVIAVPTAADVLTRKGRPGGGRLGGCRHSFGARFVHRDRGRGSVARFGSCRVLAGSPGRSGRSWTGTAPGWLGAATRHRWSSGRWSRWGTWAGGWSATRWRSISSPPRR